jgi:hypothetical protein
MPESEDRENSLEGCYGNQSPWRDWLSTNLYFQACSDLKRQCLLKDCDERDYIHIHRDACTLIPPGVTEEVWKSNTF